MGAPGIVALNPLSDSRFQLSDGGGFEPYAGQPNEEFFAEKEFLEFVRLQIGGIWFRVSDFYYWTYVPKFRRGSAEMEDNGSTLTAP